MGTYCPPNCFITDSVTQNRMSATDMIEYHSEYAGKKLFLVFDVDHRNSEFVESKKNILKGLIINDKFPYNKDPYFNNLRLEQIIREANIPENPKSKLDNLLVFLNSLQDYEGCQINIADKYGCEIVTNKLYFKNHDEYWFYINTLKERGLVDFIDAKTKDGEAVLNLKITFSGLDYIIDLQESGEQSNKCFVAMSFSETQIETREVIKRVIHDCGYQPILVDETSFNSEITINDAIISFIKQSKFLIADFTEHKHGVYFETGYALGAKKPVIYLCHKNDFSKSHFDTNHYPHIIYKDIDELIEKLTFRIRAWID